jgi:hypothetical protein
MKVRVLVVVAAAVAALLPSGTLFLGAGTARADYAPGLHDVVGLNGVPQLGTDFADDGDQFGDAGYNSAGNLYKVVTLDPAADASQRIANGNGSTLGSPWPLDPTVVMRGGTYPVQRPGGSNAAPPPCWRTFPSPIPT